MTEEMMTSRLTHETDCKNNWPNGDMISSGQYGLVLQKKKKNQCFDSIFIVITVIKMFNSLQRHIILRCQLTHLPLDFRPSLLFIETDSISIHLICLRKSINLTVFRVEKLYQNKLDFLKLKCSCLYYIYIFFLSLYY